ncbi:SLAP domain-containing protein [Lactobacillus crispatus]|nr:SLAP domain-containing protein [Aerococcus urinaeequi]
MNKLVKCSAATLLAASLFGFGGQFVNAATGYQRLTHNAYAYTYNGKSANAKLYKKGSKVKVIGSIKLKGKKYNIISGNVYIKASNFAKRRSRNVLGDGYETQLLHNSYVYNAKGQRIKGTKLRKGHSVTCYGNPIRIHGKKYVQIGNGQFVRSSNVLLSYNGPTGSDSLNHTHHNASSNTSSTNKGNSTTNKSTSGSSTTDKKDQSKPDTGKKDSDKKDQSKSDSKTPSKSGDTKNSDKPNKVDLPTQADYNALSDAIIMARRAGYQMSSYAKKKIYDSAMEKANYYIEFRDYSGNNISGADVRKVTSDLNAAVAGLDWKKEIAKFPTITVEIDKNGKRKWNWTPKAEQQVLKVVNEIYGSTDAHFLHKDPNSNKIVFTHGSFPETADTREFVKLVSSGGKRIDF